MTFRRRLLVAFTAATLAPLILLTLGVRRQLERRLTTQYQERLRSEAAVAAQDLSREGASIALRLSSLAGALGEDDRFRLGALHGAAAERGYVLDYAGRAMRMTGLSMLQLQDERGRIISSGHFRNEFDRLEPELPPLLAAVGAQAVLVRARSPDGPFLALARADSVRIGGRRFTLVGGVTVDTTFLSRFARTAGASVTLEGADSLLSFTAPAPSLPDDDRQVVTRLPVAFAATRDAGAAHLQPAALVLAQPMAELAALEGDVGHWFLAVLTLALVGSVTLAAWLSARLAGPITELAEATRAVDLDGARLQLAGARARGDEIGLLARRMEAMAARLRTSAGRLRDAERRATVGDLARQVNHDIRNGLIPIRNVLRHLGHVHATQPESLDSVFAERRGTLEASVSWLETLARNYARLSPRADRGIVDVNAVARAVAEAAIGAGDDVVRLRLAPSLSAVVGDPVSVRRILDNLVRNAIESLAGGRGAVVIETALVPGQVRVRVSDTGRGMGEAERRRAFDDFYTTRAEGTGLGLSVVRRLTMDLGGAVAVESAPGRGTQVTVVLPCAGVATPAARPDAGSTLARIPS